MEKRPLSRSGAAEKSRETEGANGERRRGRAGRALSLSLSLRRCIHLYIGQGFSSLRSRRQVYIQVYSQPRWIYRYARNVPNALNKERERKNACRGEPIGAAARGCRICISPGPGCCSIGILILPCAGDLHLNGAREEEEKT